MRLDMSVEDRLGEIRVRIEDAGRQSGRPAGSTKLVAVSMTFDADAIRPVIACGQRGFCENRVPERQREWPARKAETHEHEPQLIRPRQANQAERNESP